VADKKPGPYRNRIVGYGELPVSEIVKNPNNWRTHPKPQEDALHGVILEVGWVQTVLVNQRTGRLVDGHLRVALAEKHGMASVPVTFVDLSESEEAEVLATLDPISAMAGASADALDQVLREFNSASPDVQRMLDDLVSGMPVDALDAENLADSRPTVSLAERFIVPPFSVLDARQGYWQDRKRAWIALGIQSELGRGGGIWRDRPLDRKLAYGAG